jgi:ubiquinone/menaquinone biosynthesis C-methylase UbiE
MLTNLAFNALAANYDTDFTTSIIGVLQRNKVWQFLVQNLPKNKSLNILEINCGTGVDAFWLAQNGHLIVATDLSSEMIAVANKKKENNLNAANISFEVCGFENLKNNFEHQQFDLIFSNFAGLNCIDNDALLALHNDFEKLLKPNGLMVLVLLGKYCLLERLFFFLKFDFKKMNRRKNKALAYLSPNNYQDTWCYSNQELKTIFSGFILKAKQPIGLFIPPTYLENRIKKHPKLLTLLNLLDGIFGKIGSLSDYGDHLILHFEKKQ